MRIEKPRYLSRIKVATLAAGALTIAFGLAHAGPSPHMFGSSFGLAPDQTARLNVASVDNPDFRGDPSNLPPGPCMVQLKVFDAGGAAVVQSGPLRIAPGATLSHDLKYSDLIGVVAVDPKDGFRAQLRVASFVSRAAGASQNVAGCPSDPSLKLSVEVFDDATGRTMFMVPTGSFVPAVQ